MKKNILTLLTVFTIFICRNYALYAEDPKTLEIGAAAPAFSLPGTDGKIYTLGSFSKDKILVIIFTANHCPTAQAYEDRVDKLYREFKPKGVGFLLVSPNHPQAVCLEELGYTDLGDTFEEMKIRAKDMKYPMPYIYDGDKQEMATAYGPTTTPHVFIFDSKRKLRFCGRIDEMENPYVEAKEHDTRNAIVALLEGKQVPVEKTKTFGCSIKWANKAEWRAKYDADWKKKPVEVIEADLNGIKEVLANKSNKYRLINVWATWCGPCVIEYPEFVTMQRMYGARDFEFVSISTDGLKKKDKVLEFLKDKNSAVKNYLYSADNKYPLIEAVDKNWSGSLPYTLLVAPGGEVVYSHNGVIDPLEVRKEIMQKIGRFFADD
ncbi:MAG: redoxin [Bacteroidetes bacterium GWA2_40_15]|nr:MAG: redoxin [Bacteroidetes bacterium GWA2_40_15]OFX93786.1 MAG: redoxin [Bacteroidetes bacterium GWC2_40_22]HBH85742.1 redoxin [Bacteroidales bacterium]HBQ84206.1 redoxin [Bacteroidales bacterium]HCU21002.1 redoxin [Bacteroidales bacterium]